MLAAAQADGPDSTCGAQDSRGPVPCARRPHDADKGPDAGAPDMLVALIRHAPTPGNLERRYVGGALDEGLSEQGRELAVQARGAFAFLDPQAVLTSGMVRCEQTAGLLFGAAPRRACAGLREMLFGAFEGKAYAELAGDARYRAWVDSGCTRRCPGGEDQAAFVRRVRDCLESELGACAREGLARIACVVHAGTIMAACTELAAGPAAQGRTYWDWKAPWCGGFLARARQTENGWRLHDVEALSARME